MESPIGLLLIKKSPGISSFKALSEVKRQLGTRKVGHGGTLDPFAEGLLIVLVGKMTRFMQVMTDLPKTYRATLMLGTETDTLDPEGKVVNQKPVPSVRKLTDAAKKFTGEITQTPPAYSAIKINGKRAYDLARDGKDVTMPERRVFIYSLKMTGDRLPESTWEINCSKGTYIRSLGRDLAKEAGSCGYLAALERTAIGPFLNINAVKWDSEDLKGHLIPPYDVFMMLKDAECQTVDSHEQESIRRGILPATVISSLTDKDFNFCGLFSNDKSLLAVIRKDKGKLRYLFVV